MLWRYVTNNDVPHVNFIQNNAILSNLFLKKYYRYLKKENSYEKLQVYTIFIEILIDFLVKAYFDGSWL